ncbi:MAG: pterin-binding domain-containing protein [Planctomycetota bacterium]|jgi:CO dehydrogenase/acetyl-CoA synthase gamma subunit (corrinoid Fe-S protein)
MNDADLYTEELNLARYFTPEECSRCGAESCRDLVNRLAKRTGAPPDILALPEKKRNGLERVLSLRDGLPAVPKISTPRAGPPGLTEINDPDDGAPIVVTGNSVFTQEVLLTVLSDASGPFFFLSADTSGDTLDMAVILRSFTPEAVARALAEAGLDSTAPGSPLVIAGKAAPLAETVGAATGRILEVGPVCAAELPLYFGEQWWGKTS